MTATEQDIAKATAEAQQAAAQSLGIQIVWTPAKGQLQVQWPQVDDTIKLGMLEMAKAVLLEARVRGPEGQPLIVPGRFAPKGN